MDNKITASPQKLLELCISDIKQETAETVEIFDDNIFSCLKDEVPNWYDDIENKYVMARCGCSSRTYLTFDDLQKQLICKECEGLNIQFYQDDIIQMLFKITIEGTYFCFYFDFYPSKSFYDNIFIKIHKEHLTVYDITGIHNLISFEGNIYDAKNLFLNFDRIIRQKHNNIQLKPDYFQSLPTLTLQYMLDKINPNKNDKDQEYIIEI